MTTCTKCQGSGIINLPKGPNGEVPRGIIFCECKRTEATKAFAMSMAAIEKFIRGETASGVFPDWVYECRDAIRHRDANSPPWLADICQILGWQGGTIHQVKQAISRLVAADKELTNAAN